MFQTEVVKALRGKREVGYLIDQFNIKNGDITARVSFYISESAVSQYSQEIIKYRSNNYEAVIRDYLSTFHERIRLSILQTIEKFAVYYKGFPSSLYPIKDFRFVISSGNFRGVCLLPNQDEPLWVLLGIRILRETDLIDTVISHELYHVVAEVHEAQEKQSKLLWRWQKKLIKPIEENKRIMEASINEYIKYCRKNDRIVATNEQIKKRLEIFFGDLPPMFWNRVQDSALCVIAIELGDKEYIRAQVDLDKDSVSLSQIYLSDLKKELTHITNSRIAERDSYIATIKAFQFITCFCYMPFFSLAYGVLGGDFRPIKKRQIIQRMLRWARRTKANASSELIDYFKSIVLQLCEADVANSFLNFFEAYLEIVKEMAIYTNPWDPDVTKEIHDEHCRKKASDAYKFLNREFKKLIEEVKIHQQKSY